MVASEQCERPSMGRGIPCGRFLHHTQRKNMKAILHAELRSWLASSKSEPEPTVGFKGLRAQSEALVRRRRPLA